MTDITLTRSGEFDLAQAEAQSEEAQDFLDGYLPTSARDLVVVDSGRIILPSREVDQLLTSARLRGLTLEEAKVD